MSFNAGSSLIHDLVQWTVDRFSDGTYMIRNFGRLSYANIRNGYWTKQGDSIVGGTHSQRWKIMEMLKCCYCNYVVAINEENGERREQELKSEFWEGMVADGCRTERFKDSHDSSWRIIDGLVEKGRTQDPLSRESVDLRLATIENKIGQMSD
jgi:hypothetical protein